MAPDAPRVRPPHRLAQISIVLAAALGLAYPFLVYLGWQRFSPRWILGGALVLMSLRAFGLYRSAPRASWAGLAWPWVIPGLFLLAAVLSGRRALALYWPVLVSLALLWVFGQTLVFPPPLVERFARIQKAELTTPEIVYCRQVTRLWCLFFVANGAVAWTLARAYSVKAWMLYNGFISYLLIGSLFFLEYIYRHWRFRPPHARVTQWMNRFGL